MSLKAPLALSDNVHVMNPQRGTSSSGWTMFEYRADFRDLALDGRHWRAQFGGTSGHGPKMGAYICCGPWQYMLFRLLMAATVSALVALEILRGDLSLDWFLYAEHWVLLVALAYFMLAASLTATAICSNGGESKRPPVLVVLCWMCYGMLLPSSFATALTFALVTQGGDVLASPLAADASSIWITVGLFALVALDLWVNRQPYYATFHGFCGVAFCWSYMLFNLVWCVYFKLKDGHGHGYIYRQLDWHVTMTSGKLIMLELFVILPYFNALYWAVLWARRRARVAAKHSAV